MQRPSLCAGLVLLTALGLPCAGTWHPGQPVEVASERAVIVWEPERQREHFIRSASFRGKGADFGFLVPTPGVPRLLSAKSSGFDSMARITDIPKAVRGGGGMAGGGFGGGATGSVEVVQEKEVGAYHAATLAADDAESLAKWLKENGYPSRPELTKWVGNYVESGWYITAFKISREPEAERTTIEPVCISFSTQRPFYPYREPNDELPPPPKGARRARSLTLYFVAPKPMEGVLTTEDSRVPWLKAAGHAPMPENPGELGKELRVAERALKKTVVTTFLDPTVKRPDGDIYFQPENSTHSATRQRP
jgi:hypothetical protein